MKKRVMILAGLMVAAQLMSAYPAAAEDAAEEAAEEMVVDEEAASSEIQVEEEEAEEETEETEVEAEASSTRPSYDFHEFLKELGTYKGMEVEVAPKMEITDEILKEEIEYRAQGVKETIEEGTVQDGDIAHIDYMGKKDGVAFDGGTAEGYDLGIGSGTFIPGFEEGLVGVNIGDTVDIPLTFPEEYHAPDLAGAEVVFTVTVHSVQRDMEYGDAAVEKLTEGEYTDVASYEASVKAELEEISEQNQRTEAENLYWSTLLDSSDFEEVPADVLDFDVEENINYSRQMMMFYGVSLEDYIGSQGMTLDDYKVTVRESMERSLKYEMLEMAIVEAEGIEISEEDFLAYADELAAQYETETETFLEMVGESDVWRNMYYERSKEILLSNNTFVEKTEE